MGARGAKAILVGLARLATLASALMCLGAVPWIQSAPSITKVRFGGDAAQTRIVLELSRATRGRPVETGDRSRVQLMLQGLDAPAGLGGAGQGLVRAWSIDGSGAGAALRLTFSRPSVIVRRFLLAPSEGSASYRYVIDVAADGPAPPAPPVASAQLNRIANAPVHIRKVIVVDAGHGGKDPGASGGDAHEKDLTLAAARALKRRLERDGRYDVVLTRGGDAFVPLEDRVQIARRAEADLFISLHADAGGDPGVRGATVYTLSDKGSDRVQRQVMNGNDWFINVSLPSHDRAVNQILLDLTQRATKNQSSAFADLLVSHVGEQAALLQHGHRDAGYVVLLAPDVPAVLLEMGFITNPVDETALKDPQRRARLMGAVGDAIDEYFAGQRRLAAR